jgi:hypoxanthine phosphoribosyltransferase
MSTRTDYLWSNHSQHDDIDHILIDEATLQRRIAELGQMISCEYAGKDLLLVAILKGSIMFAVDLMRHISIPHEVDFMATSSYSGGLCSSGTVRILQDLKVSSLEGRNVLLVEDIIDSGRTISHLVPLLQERQPADIRILTLLDKPQRREVVVKIDWIGFSIPDEFVVGYGLDYAELYRNLPYIGVLKPDVYRDPT